MSKAKRAAYTRVKGTKVQMKHVGAVQVSRRGVWRMTDTWFGRAGGTPTASGSLISLSNRPAFLGIRHLLAYRQFSSLLFVFFFGYYLACSSLFPAAFYTRLIVFALPYFAQRSRVETPDDFTLQNPPWGSFFFPCLRSALPDSTPYLCTK
jgi:hypothetical protein